MKKILALLFVAVLVISFGGCAKSNDTHNHSHSDTETATQNRQNTNTSENDGFGSTAIENSYANTYLELSFEAPDPWYFFDKEALANFTGADPGLSAKEVADTLGAAYDMMAVENTKEASVSLVFENLIITAGSTLTAKEYVDSVIKQGLAQAAESTLESESEVTLGKHSYIKVVITISDTNKPMVQTHYLRAIDDYMVHITTSIPLSNCAEIDFESMFK